MNAPGLELDRQTRRLLLFPGALVVLVAWSSCVGGGAQRDEESGIEHVSSAVTLTSGGAQVNCGSTLVVAPFVADANYSGGGTVTRTNTIDLSQVTNPAPMAVYQSQRYGNFTYTFGGFPSYAYADVRLHFADTHWTTAGQRVFNVDMNGQNLLYQVDIVAAALGGNRAYVVPFRDLQADVNGKFVFTFTTVKDAATVSAIEVYPRVNWLQYGGDSVHSSNNKSEFGIGAWSASRLAPIFSVSGATPPLVANGLIYTLLPGTTSAVRAYDAKLGGQMWSTASSSKFGGSASGSFVATPALDTVLTSVYVAQQDGFVHRYNAQTGGELTLGWGNGASGVQFTKKYSKEPAVTAMTVSGQNSAGVPYLYVGVGNCDEGGTYTDCQGHVVSINLNTAIGRPFNAICTQLNPQLIASGACAHGGGAIWNRGGVAYDPISARLFAKTANSTTSDNVAGGYYANSVVALDYTGNGKSGGLPLDSYTPGSTMWADDIGEAGLTVLDNVSGSSYPHMGIVTGNLDGWLRLVNLDNLSGQSGPGHSGGELSFFPASGQLPEFGNQTTMFSTIATWVNPADNTTWFFAPLQQGVGPGNKPSAMYAFKINPSDSAWGGKPSMVFQWRRGCVTGVCSGAVIANGALFYDDGSDLMAVNAATGNVSGTSYTTPSAGTTSAPLWCSAGITGNHCNTGITSTSWKAAPVIANGVLYYATTNGTIKAFAPL